MKRPILDTRRKVLSAVIAAYPGGRECAAARLGLDLKKFDNHLYENAGHRPLSDEQVLQLEQDTRTTYLADYICGMYQGVFVSMPEVGELDNVDLYARSIKTEVKEGRVGQVIAKALADQRISQVEADEIFAAHREHMAAIAEEVRAVIALHMERKQ
ncbi:hypothetical protein E8F20_27605 [Pseudomonas sp. BN415]|uniref:YmfL family putative regulatory protein n=1 Tax=Pseudomonas sp. BN415 TaxID=2567889 RepID=UPI002454EF88|nr:YmfL family putative regulatory protein [Pseudomonas sp. BN415]MDH4585618.1 hypothetical protein [Pseudomonas sp. BN415]